MVIGCSMLLNVCPRVCYCLGGEREQIQHHPQNCYLKPKVAAKCLLLGNSFKLARTSLELSRKCWAVVIPCDFVWALQIGFERHLRDPQLHFVEVTMFMNSLRKPKHIMSLEVTMVFVLYGNKHSE